jgi:hypothetical protein
MNRRKWLWAALLAVPTLVGGGLAYANSHKASAYTCPLTGEGLPCPKCCPLNQERAATADKTDQTKPAADEGYTCPLTGEKLGCPGCCPLNQEK